MVVAEGQGSYVMTTNKEIVGVYIHICGGEKRERERQQKNRRDGERVKRGKCRQEEPRIFLSIYNVYGTGRTHARSAVCTYNM